MPDDDDDQAKSMEDAVTTLIGIARVLAEQHDICQLCLIFNAAAAAEDAEERGLVHHRDAKIVHPEHKTVL